MAVATDDLLAQVLAAGEPAERPLRRQMLDVLLSPTQPPRMSYEEFLAWADEDMLAEWVNGEVHMASPASLRHQDIMGFLVSVVGVYVEERNLGAVVTAKFYEYEQAGVPEYWLLDPRTRRAEFYQLDPAGVYQLIAPDQEGVYRSAVLPGFWLRVAWLWQQPLPRVLDVLRELRVV